MKFDIPAIKSSTRLIDVFRDAGYEVKKQGKNHVCLCPFHTDTHPSMYLYSDTDRFYCFACNAKGDVIDAYAKLHNVSLGEALQTLAMRTTTSYQQQAYTDTKKSTLLRNPTQEARNARAAAVRDNVKFSMDDWRQRKIEALQPQLEACRRELDQYVRAAASPVEATGSPEFDRLVDLQAKLLLQLEDIANADYPSLLAMMLQETENPLPTLGSVN